MSRFTPVYSDFIRRLDEVILLQSQAAAFNRSSLGLGHSAKINALCRGSVVLLSSHIEAYVKELGEHTLDAIVSKQVCRSKISDLFFYYMSRQNIENVRRGDRPESIVGNLRSFINNDVEMWDLQGAFPAPIVAQNFNGGFSNPTFEKVKTYFGRFGYQEFRQDFMRTLGRAAQSTMTGLDQIVSTRNAIAHGDPGATKTPTEVKVMIDLSKVFCRTVDTIFAKWCSDSICTIR